MRKILPYKTKGNVGWVSGKRSYYEPHTYHRVTHQAMLIFAQKQDYFDGLRAESSEYFTSFKPALTHPTFLFRIIKLALD